MSCCRCKQQEITKPPQRDLTNLEYLELLSRVDEMKAHAELVHKKEQWRCKWLWHWWERVVDEQYNSHVVCHRCGKYKPVSYGNASAMEVYY